MSAAAGDLLCNLLGGDQMALGRVLSILESTDDRSATLRSAIREHTGRALVVGVTGPPGAGKSTLVGAMVSAIRAAGDRVAVLAVDPSSPLSGGALLGDRTRMAVHSDDSGVFIRSLSSRGQHGGLSSAVPACIDAIDAAGWPVILLETVGAGQSDVDVTLLADVTVVVSVPGLGDDLQAIKAGILEIADVLVVNKCDLPGAEVTARQLRRMVALRAPEAIRPPIVRTCAADGTGIEQLLAEVRRTARPDRGSRRLKEELFRESQAEFARRVQGRSLDQAYAEVAAGRRTLAEAVDDLVGLAASGR